MSGLRLSSLPLSRASLIDEHLLSSLWCGVSSCALAIIIVGRTVRVTVVVALVSVECVSAVVKYKFLDLDLRGQDVSLCALPESYSRVIVQIAGSIRVVCKGTCRPSVTLRIHPALRYIVGPMIAVVVGEVLIGLSPGRHALDLSRRKFRKNCQCRSAGDRLSSVSWSGSAVDFRSKYSQARAKNDPETSV